MHGIVNFTRVTNIFSGSVERWRSPADGRTMSCHLGGADSRFVVEVNGRRVEGDYVPRAGDRVVFAEAPAEASTIALIVIGLVVAAGSYLINRKAMGKKPGDRGADDFGPRNSFGGIQTISANGVPIPLIYGEVRVGGNIVDSFESASLDEDLSLIDKLNEGLTGLGLDIIVTKPNHLSRTKSVLNTRVVYCLGPIEDMTDLEIDSRPASEFPGLHTTTRLGKVQQPSIAGFNQSVNTRVLASPVLAASPVSVTTQTEIDTAEVVLRFPRGIFKLKSDGFKYLHLIEVKVEYRLVNSSVWTDAGTFTVNDFSTTALDYRVKLPELDRNFYEVRVTRVTADETNANKISDLEFFFLNEIQFQERNHPGIAMAAFQQLPGDQVSPVNPTNYTALVKGFNDIRIYSDPFTFATDWTDNPAWCCAHFLTEPLKGLGKFFSWDDIDIPSFIAWAAHADELVEDGNGHLETRATFNRASQTPTNAFEVLEQFAVGSGAMLVFKGAKFRAVIDEPRPVRQLFHDGNIKAGSLGMAWFPKPELPTRIWGDFVNVENSYNLDSMMQEDPDIDPTAFQHEKRIQLLHLTRPSQVARELMNVVNINKFVTRGVELRTGLQGLGLDLGDVFGVSTRSIARGIGSGLIVHVALDDKTLQLDDDVTLDGVSTYEIQVQHLHDGTIDTKTIVTPGPVTTNIVEVADKLWSRAIQAGDKYAIGIATETVELFRADEIHMGDLGPGFEMRIRGGLFDERVYDLTPVSNPEVVVGDAPDGRDRVPPRIDPSGFRISYRSPPRNSRQSRQQRRVIDVDWEPPNFFAIDHYEVWWRDLSIGNPVGTWIRGGETKARRFELEVGIDADTEYEVAVRAVSPNGLTLPLDSSTSDTVITSDDPVEPPATSSYTDFTDFYECAGTAGLVGENGQNFTEQGTVPEVAGKFGSARGPCDPTQSGIAEGFTRNVSGAPWDTRVSQGFQRASLTGWFRLASNAGDQEFAAQARAAAAANTRQWMLRSIFQDLNPGDDGPVLFIWDHGGTGPFGGFQLGAAVRVDQGPMPTGVWCNIGFAIDLVAGLARLFLGVPGEGTYFDERAIDPAWDAFEATAVDVVTLGRHSGFSTGGLNGDMDHVTWWNGRALTLLEFLDHWNAGDGLARDNY